MKLILQTLFFLLPLSATQAQRIAITAVVTEPTCNQNGQICLRVTGGTRPYRYDLDSIGGSIHLSQDDSCFTGRGRGTYQVRVTDFLGRKDSTFVTIVNHYVPMTLTAIQIGGCVKLTVTGGRKPYRYYAHNWQIGQFDTIIGDSTTRMLCCLSNGDYSFRVEDSCQNVYPTTLTVTQLPAAPSIVIDTVQHGDSLTISLIRSTGGEPPYTYICYGDVRGDRTNSTGLFTGLKGCEFTVFVVDRCGRKTGRSVSFATPLMLNLLCTNSNLGTASMTVTGGMPPYTFSEFNTRTQNFTGQFSNLPIHQTYSFQVMDACRAVDWAERSRMFVETRWESCPFTGDIDLISGSNNGWLTNPRSWFPVTYICENCVPIRTMVDSGNGSTARASRVRFPNMPAGNYHFKVINHCGEQQTIDVQTDTGSVQVGAWRICNTHQILAQSNNGHLFILKDKFGNLLDSNRIGVFAARNADTVFVEARESGCRNSANFMVPPDVLDLSYDLDCEAQLLRVQSNGGQSTFFLKDKFGNPLDSNRTGVFQLPRLDTFKIEARSWSCLSREQFVFPPDATQKADFCLTLSMVNNRYTWNVVFSPRWSSGARHSYRLRGGPDSINRYYRLGSEGRFNGVPPGTYTLEYDCNAQTIVLPAPDTIFEVRIGYEIGCPPGTSTSFSVRSSIDSVWREWAQRNQVVFCLDPPQLRYFLRDSLGISAGTNTNGSFSVNARYRLYTLSTYFLNRLMRTDTIRLLFYERPTLQATFEPICIGDSTSNIVVNVVNGLPMYTFKVIQPAIPLQQTIASNQTTFAQLPFGTYTIRVEDRCRISADITGSIAPLTVTTRYRRECHNHLVLITNELRNAKYRWTNRRGDSIGNTPILTLRNTSVDSQTYHVTIFWKNCQWRSRVYVPRNDLQIIQSQIDTTICEEDFITLNGHTYPKAGVFRDTFLNQNGCDSVLILNLRKQNCGYELPNAFAPEMELLYTLYPNPKVAQIEQLTIFDKWGNQIYQSEGAFVSGQTGWDGTFHGQRVDVGVFVAVARIVYKNGTRAVLKTDLNVLY
jgi:SprB repeat